MNFIFHLILSLSFITWVISHRYITHITVAERERRHKYWSLVALTKIFSDSRMKGCMEDSITYLESGFWNKLINLPPCNAFKKWRKLPVDKFECKIVNDIIWILNGSKLSDNLKRQLKNEIFTNFPQRNIFCKEEIKSL
jgi:hypothetical protein